MATPIPAASTEYMYSTVSADHDLTGVPAEVALPAKGTTPTTWFTAAVTNVADNGDGTWTSTLRVLVGPEGGVVTLSKGSYDWWSRLQDNPEVPARLAGQVQAT